jgi:hypothetical protein
LFNDRLEDEERRDLAHIFEQAAPEDYFEENEYDAFAAE